MRLRPFAAAVLAAGAILAVTVVVEGAEQRRYRQAIESSVLAQLSAVQSQLAEAFGRRFSRVEALAAFAEADPEAGEEETSRFVRSLVGDDPALRALLLAPGGRMSGERPGVPSRSAGGDVLADPLLRDTATRALDEDVLVASEPIAHGDLQVLVAMAPAGSAAHPSTLALGVVDIGHVFEEVGLRSSPWSRFAVRDVDPMRDYEAAFFGDPRVFGSAAGSVWVRLPGRTWDLAAAPREALASPLVPRIRAAGGLLALLLGIAVWAWARSPERLRRAVREATGALRESERRLLDDIEERRRTEAELVLTNRTLRAMIEAFPLPTAVLDAGDRVRTWNPAAERVFGWTEEEVLGEALPVVPPYRDAESRDLTRRVLRGESFTVDVQRWRKDGSPIELSLSTAPVRDDDGRVSGMIAVYMDITERNRYEAELRRMASYPELNPMPIIELDRSGKLTYANPAAGQEFPDLRMAGTEHGLVRGLLEVTDDMARRDDRYRMREVRMGDAVYEQHITLTPQVHRIRIYILDISERKRAELALTQAFEREREAADRLRGLDEMKNAFLAAVSHELRTPLASVLGFALTLERDDVELPPDEMRHILGRLAANARKLDRLLTDLLDMDRLARGILEPHRRPTDVAELVRRVVEESERIRTHLVDLDLDRFEVDVDPAKVERVLENLLANAARHTPSGTQVWVRVRKHLDGVLIVVEDAGPGVPDEIKRQIFHPFQQGARPDHTPGTGIGLSLVARFAELHGGRAWVEDRKAGGASFHVYLPSSGGPQMPSELSEQSEHAS